MPVEHVTFFTSALRVWQVWLLYYFLQRLKFLENDKMERNLNLNIDDKQKEFRTMSFNVKTRG